MEKILKNKGKSLKLTGFTLIELLAVVIILGIISLIATFTIDKFIKDSKDTSYELQINNIIEDAKSWSYKHTELLPSVGNSYTLTLKDLKDESFIEEDIINPKTNEPFEDTLTITITNNNGDYVYVVND